MFVASLLACCALFPTQAAGADAERPKIRAERYAIEVSFRPAEGYLRAKAAVTLRASDQFKAIEFELNPKLAIREVADSQGRQLGFERSRRLGSPRLSVRLAEPAAAEQNVTIIFTYEGALPPGALDYITKDGILLRDESRWYPAVDISAFTQNEITVSVPAGWTAVTSGELASQATEGASAQFTWKTARPVSSRSLVAVPGPPATCLASAGAAPADQHPFPVCFAAQRGGSAADLVSKATALLSRYTRAFGGYPHRQLMLVEGFPGTQGATGYTAPGLLVVSPDVLKFHNHPGWAPEFLPHEIAHQWFPSEVALASEADGWLAEGLAEYIAWRYLRETAPDGAHAMVARAMRDSLAPDPLRPLSLGLRLFALEEWDVTHATLYQRGMLVFRTLETVIGRERVDRALRELYARRAGTSASIADFRSICEEISGRELGWFFDYFIGGTEVPEIELRRIPSAAPGELAGEIVVRNVPPEFSVRVEMRMQTTSGLVDHSVATRGEVTPFSVTLLSPATQLTLDPDARILRWTEAARRNRLQQVRLAGLGELERAGQFHAALRACEQALELDPENLASNHQHIRFTIARLQYRLGLLERAWQAFGRVLALGSLDPMASDFYRAWARVYRARINRRRGRLAAAHAEAKAGLAINSPALETLVTWPESSRPTSASQELRALLRPSRNPSPQRTQRNTE